MRPEAILDAQELANIETGDRSTPYATYTETFGANPPVTEVYVLHDQSIDRDSWPEDLHVWLTISLVNLTQITLEDWGLLCRHKDPQEVLVYSEHVEQAKQTGDPFEIYAARLRRESTIDYTNNVGRGIVPPITAKEVENP